MEIPKGQLKAIIVDVDIQAWNAAGFTGADAVTIGSTTVVPTGSGETAGDGHRNGIIGAAIEGVGELDGLALGSWDPSGAAVDPGGHPNAVVSIDHIVVMTPDCDRTTAAFEAQGLEARRVRQIELPDGDRRQTFFWMGDVICEVVGPEIPEGDGPARWWGLALTVSRLDVTTGLLGDLATLAKPAVQPGRFVSTLRRDAGLGVPILFISEHVQG